MKHINKCLLLFALMLLPQVVLSNSCDDNKACCSGCTTSQNTWQPRSFSAHMSREILSEKTLFATENDGDWIGTWGVNFEYMENRNRNKCDDKCRSLGIMPLWSGTNTMTVGNNGSDWTDATQTAVVESSTKAEIDAYQFGLGDMDGLGSITVCPEVKQFGADILFYLGQNNHSKGFWAKIKAPIGAMTIDPRLKETSAVKVNEQLTATDSQAGRNRDNMHIFQTYPAPNNRPDHMKDAFAGGSTDGSDIPNSLRRPIHLEKAKIANCKLTALRMADLTVAVGYNVIGSENGHLGLGLRISAPTGNVPTSEYALEPIFGRAGHWGFGGEVNAHYNFWNNDSCDQYADFWFNAEALHLFAGRNPHWRTFDLKQNGAGSKYLLTQFYHPGYATVAGTADNPPANPTGRVASYLTQAANITTLPVLSKFSVEGNVALLFDFHSKNWNFGIGYDFWARSCESLKIDCCELNKQNLPDLNDFAVVGRQADSTFNYTVNPITENFIGGAAANGSLNRCEPLAKIGDSLPRLDVASATGNTYHDRIKDGRESANRIPSKIADALDIDGARAKRALSSKVFAHAGYMWKEHAHTPMISLSASAEFSHSYNNALQFWGVGANGSINF